ncbi:uncharacterized protein LOC110452497 [Mizuhopecten yessoensis]|uniref:Glucans biosynthesis glucosyltransferase H n=1 Tax=Mizuhopecten yessoensis TaxID=6573 RepID=A0A210R525_MIZYE|nr:uncharacterized protein LOC110452497 [Mizuhopecten yessoensis]OWF56021.1 Glucans biosynthesis glucosyltransferase H [Mizuhopecten yessoensis]
MKNHRIVIYFVSWAIVSAVICALNVLNINWETSDLATGIAVVVFVTILQGTVIEIPIQTVATLIVGGHRREVMVGDGSRLSAIINYNLLAHTKEDIEECFKCMYDAYMGNLSPTISAVLVSATSGRRLREHEFYMRDFYRVFIFDVLYTEGLAFSRGDYKLVHPSRLEHFWSWYKHIEKSYFLNDILRKLCNSRCDEFMLVQRNSRVLRKCGQYQDLMLLSYGERFAFTYCDQTHYGRNARAEGDQLFLPHKDVDNICGRKFDYTVVADGDTGIPFGCVFKLLDIADANPTRGIIQPAVTMENQSPEEDTIFMYLESARHTLFEPMSNAMNALLNRCSFYGKGLIRNATYIERVIGRRGKLIELVPIDILSHDTYEATVLNPLFVSTVAFSEQPPLNYISWNIRERRWNRGEILNAMYFWEWAVGIPLRGLQRIFRRKEYVKTKRRTAPNHDFVSSYVAHSPLRQMLMKPFLLVYILIHVNLNLRYQWAPVIAILFLIIVFPKFAVCRRYNIKFVFAETFLSVMQFTPEAIVGCVRIARAFHANVSAHVNWVPSRQVESEFRESNPFLKSFIHLGFYSVVAVAVAVAVYIVRPDGVLAYFLLGAVFALPIFAGCTAVRYKTLKSLKCRCSRNFRYFGRTRGRVDPETDLWVTRLPDVYTRGSNASSYTTTTASSLY